MADSESRVIFLMRLIGLTFIFLAISSFGAEVLRVGASQTIIAISQDPSRAWRLNDSVCVLDETHEVVCGTIVKSSPQMAVVKLAHASDMVARGQKVKLSVLAATAVAPVRKPAATQLMQSVERDKESKTYYHNLSGGFSVGSGFYFPLLHFQRLVTPSIAIGIMPSYYSVSTGAGSLSAMAGTLTFNYYGHEFFRGLWLQTGVGLSFFSSTNTTSSSGSLEQQSTSMSSLLTVGWRGYWDLGFNIGVCGGFQYLKDPGFSGVQLSGAGVQPMVLVDVGFNF